MTTVVYHSVDFDGVFSREVAKRALGEDGVRYLGWNFVSSPRTPLLLLLLIGLTLADLG